MREGTGVEVSARLPDYLQNESFRDWALVEEGENWIIRNCLLDIAKVSCIRKRFLREICEKIMHRLCTEVTHGLILEFVLRHADL